MDWDDGRHVIQLCAGEVTMSPSLPTCSDDEDLNNGEENSEESSDESK
jgi:hypothetical protein